MNVMRINSAHDDLPAWTRMVEHLRRAVAETGRACRVLFDLQGPKLRTGDIAPGPAVVRWSPHRGVRGEVLRPIRVRLVPEGRMAPSDHDVLLPFEGDWPPDLAAGDEILVMDCRGKSRSLRVLAVDAAGTLTESRSTVYVESGAELSRRPADATAHDTDPIVIGRIGALPPSEPAIMLRRGDLLWVTGAERPGRPASRDTDGQRSVPASIPCTLPEVFTSVEVGQRILFDDGKLGGVVERVSGELLEVRITQARARGERLRADKGINLPDSKLELALLSDADLAHLDFAVTHADMVGLSFVRTPDDVLELERELARRGGSALGIVLKIETRAAFERLPALLLTALRSPPVGVMVARGDLGVELGFERLAEVQEQVLWLCEAAHVPVIWATQVLESLAKKGRPSRAEVTDAAMSGRAECVMLNKGPHVLEAVRFLDDVMGRMQAHQSKKRSTLRRLSVSAGVEEAT
jgi:pyruvate kinase